MILVPAAHLQARVAERPSGYLEELAPALVRVHPDGSHEYDDSHPAWLEAVAKYRPAARGLGDTVERVLDATGIGPVAKRAITALTGRPCGCAKRRDALNRLVPYTRDRPDGRP